LSAFSHRVPVELFGRLAFPAITDAPYFFTLGPHNFYWFSLEPAPAADIPKAEDGTAAALPALSVAADWREIFRGGPLGRLEALLPRYLRAQPWFFGRAHTIKQVTLTDFVQVPMAGSGGLGGGARVGEGADPAGAVPGLEAALTFWQIDFLEAGPEWLVLPLAFAAGDLAAPVRAGSIAELVFPDASRNGVICDGLLCPPFAAGLVGLLRARERLRGEHGELEATRMPSSRELLILGASAVPTLHHAESGHTTIVFGDKVVLKFFRRAAAGVNPELEISRFLTERNFPQSPRLLGALEYVGADERPATLAVAKGFVAQAVTAWDFTLDALSRYYDRVLAFAAQGHTPQSPPPPPAPLPGRPPGTEPADGPEYVGTYLEVARLLGERSAELHLALASGAPGGEFSKEAMMPHYLRGLFQGMRSLAVGNLRRLRKQLKSLPPELGELAQRAAGLEAQILQRYRRLIEQSFEAARIRIHGAFHLGQVLWTGRDFIFPDLEGDARASLGERRIKRSPLQDTARMLRSFHHAAEAAMKKEVELGVIGRENWPQLEPWVRQWTRAVCRTYVRAYSEKLRSSGILPAEEDKLRTLLVAHLLNQVMDELGAELRAGGERVQGPLQAILDLVGEPAEGEEIAKDEGEGEGKAEG
ncbi:MAG: alpha-glucosidase C-terminal domain-containing protein, partial [Limisphaerales bacterium]